jgi:hypothetical protein
MATFDNNLKLEEIGTGEASGTWGTKTNANLELIGEALGYGTKVGFASDANNTNFSLTNAPTSDGARAMYLKLTSGASLTATRTITFADTTIKRVQIIENATTGGQSITIKSGSSNAADQVTIPNGQAKMVYFDGGGGSGKVIDAFAGLNVGPLTVEGGGATTGLTIDNTATDGDPFLSFALSGTKTFTMGVDDGESDKFRVGTTAIGTSTMLEMDSTKNVDIVGHNGSSVGLKLGGTLVTSTAAQLNAAANAASTGKAIAMAIVFG